MAMIASLLMGILSDAVFDSTASLGRSFLEDFSRYLDKRGFQPAPRRVPAC